MTLLDRFGAPVSHRNQDEVDCFGEAAERLLGYQLDPVAMIKNLLDHAPDFVMARCFLAGIYLIASDKRRQRPMLREYKLLLEKQDTANDRERAHINAIGLWAKGHYYAASQAYADILNDWPRDIVALQFGHQTDFLLGHVSSTRDRPARIRSHWSERDNQFSYILGMQAFGLEESGHYVKAQALAEKCVTLNKKDTWGIHALAHCYEMQGNVEQGIRFMLDYEPYWGEQNSMRIHNRWHFSLFYLERCEFSHVLALHDQYMQVDKQSELMDMHDSAALLWRLQLAGVDVGQRWEPVVDRYTEVAEHTYNAFTDIHAMMGFVASGRDLDAQRQLNALTQARQGTSDIAVIIRMAGLPLVKGIQAFGQGRYDVAIEYLTQARHHGHLVGGSVAQRDVINLTLLEACKRSGNKNMAQALVNERTLLRPHSPLLSRYS